MHFYPKNVLPLASVKRFIIIFYVIGILGFVFSYTRTWFVTITPLALLLNIYLLAVYHSRYIVKELWLFLMIFILSFLIECLGVNTGWVFGNYVYGKALGFKIFDTPVLIGLNWLFLLYGSYEIVHRLSKNPIVHVLLPPSLMLVYDIIMEQLAPKMDMWHWENAWIPIQNYIAWWVIAFGFLGIFKILKINFKNPLAGMIFLCQLIFFLLLFCAYKYL